MSFWHAISKYKEELCPMNNLGLLNEDKIQITLNNARYLNLSNHWKGCIQLMFGASVVSFFNRFKRLECSKTTNFIKPDIKVSYLDRTKYVSIKGGKCKCLHMEQLKSFIIYLLDNGISKRTIETIILCHFGDGTLDGSGAVRHDYHEVFQMYKARVIEANKELNQNIEFVKKTLDRAVFQGVDPEAPRADFIYYGDEEFGTLVAYQQVYKYIERKPGNWSFYENLHIGPLIIRPHGRYAHKEVVSEKRHNEIQLNWPHLQEDLQYIVKNYGFTI